jgi:hypothetical protein
MSPGADVQGEILSMAAAHGLLQRARAFLASQGHPEPMRPDGDGDRAPAIREADRARILEEIEREVAGARTPVTPELLRFTPRRRGSIMPIAVNLGALVVIAAGVLGAIWLSRQREQSAVAATATLTTAEGKLLEALKEESEEQLAGKDREIADIRGKLAGLDEERERLRVDADARVSAKEQELSDAMAAVLETERQKLLASGLSEAAVTKRVADLEAKTRAESERQLAALRQQAEADRVAQEQAAEQLRAEYQRSLSAAQTDRSRIQEEAARKQADLEAGYRQKQLSLEQDKAAALAELETLRRAREREALVLDQFVSYYREVRNEIAANRPEAAAAVLARFRAYLDEPSVTALPVMSQRRPVELFLIGSLEEIARARATTAADEAASQSLVASAGLVAAVAGLVEQGEALYADRDYAKAREVYLAALARIPAVQTGTERLAEIERIADDQGRRAVSALFAEGNTAYLAGDTDLATDRYRRGLEALAADRGLADTLIAQLTQIGAIRERAAAAAAAPAAVEGGRDEVADAAERAALLAELTTATAEMERLRAEGTAAASARDAAIAERDAAATARDAAVAAQATAVTSRNAAIAERDKAATERDTALAERDRAIFALATERDHRSSSLADLAAFRVRAAHAITASAGTRESMLSLVQTKVLVQKVLLSDAVLAEYPDLADRLDRYLVALAAESRGEAHLETLRDLDEVLSGLAAGTVVPDEVVARRTAGGQQDLLLGILDTLKTLLE